MPKNKSSSGKNFIRKIRSKKSRKKRQLRKKRQQRGGKIVMAQRYFNEGYPNHYYSQEQLQQMGNVNPYAVSHGTNNGTTNSVGPVLHPQVGLNPMTGGGVLPAEYFGGNSGRYFAEGSPELDNCTHAYGVSVPTSHGVVMGGENSGWMGPNLAAFPNHVHMTGGGKRRRRRKTKKTKRKQRKSKRSRK